MASSLPNCPLFEFAAKYYSGTGDSCVRQTSFFGGKAVLNQGVGYSVILGFGAFFSHWNPKKSPHKIIKSSPASWSCTYFSLKDKLSGSVVGRNVKTGLIASVIISQVLLFGVMAIEMKRKAPYAHTICEIVKARWGTAAHLVFLTFCFLTNIIVTAMLLLGGSAVVNALTGVNINAASFLIPLGVIVYTLAGGLKATFLASYIHSVIEPLTHNGQSCGPVSGNYKGSYLTMLSSGGLVFGIINIVGNFGTMFLDNGYWVSAIAAKPSSTHKGYLLGGLVWFAVPFSLATSLGLEALALDLPITASVASHGLVPPATTIALMGKGGSILLLTMLFIVSRGVVLGFGCFMGFLAAILNKAGVSLGWMYLTMGVFIGFAVLPIAFMLLWRKANAIGAILGMTIGCILGIITWLSIASVEYGRVNLDTTGRNAPMLAGNLVSILTGGAIHAVCSFLWPHNHDWETTKQITMVEKEKSELLAEEFKEEKLIRAKAWIVKWGVGITVVIVLLWPLLSLPAAIAWGTIGSAVVIVLPLTESRQTIQSVILGMFTNDRLMEKVEELNLKLNTIMLAIPAAERLYLLEKGKAKKNEASEPDAHIGPA
ncbi:hypothetical protein TEA_010053 [Camellia sinensis var. sinensis]|uniref:Urea-proton symporter DUR3 n=1 Tax=Camellia sinensis var. sinensis TaxID=542762 RepID=A0A4V3WLV8_CAMSN|nr:hypothetical protein TEA_010053 [Camellia sinensis var. sinensis]